MRKEFVVMRIDAAPDGSPYVLVTLSLAKDMAEGNQPPNPSTTNVMGFSNMDVGNIIYSMNGDVRILMRIITSRMLGTHIHGFTQLQPTN